MARTRISWTKEEIATLKDTLSVTTRTTFWKTILEKLPSKTAGQIRSKLRNDKLHIRSAMYSPESIKILEEELSKSPDSLITAFDKAAYRLGVSTNSLQREYYTPTSPIYRGKLHTCFVLVSKRRVSINSKNSVSIQPTKNSTALKKKVWSIVRELNITPNGKPKKKS